MPRLARVDVGNEIYHVLNRANGRLQIFDTRKDYLLFEKLMTDAKELIGMRILAYVLMPNHWHLVLHPHNNGDLGLFMHRLTNTHTRQVHVRTGTVGSGHLYQGRYKSFLVDSDVYFLTVIKYVERNPVRAKLTRRCEEWQWCSAWRRIQGTPAHQKLLAPPPLPFPRGYRNWINTADKEDDLREIRHSVTKGVPYGNERWVSTMVNTHHLETTTRSTGRPRNVT